MRNFGFLACFVFFASTFTACDKDAAKNRNASIVANYNKSTNDNSQNANGNTESNKVLDEEEVPNFTDANEALKKGGEYIDVGNTKNAVDALRQAAKLDPDLAEAHFKLGIAYDLLESEKEAQAANTSTPDEKNENTEKNGSKSRKKSEKTDSEKSFENAVTAYKKFIRKNPKDHGGYYNLGRAYNKLYDDVEAEKALRKAVDLNGDDSLYRTEYGAVLIKLAKYPEAIRQLKKATDLDEGNFKAEDLLVEARAGKKRTDFNKKAQEQK